MRTRSLALGSVPHPHTTAEGIQDQYQAALAAVTAPAFRTASARDKQDTLWSFISKWPYEQLPSMRCTNSQLMRRLMSRAFLRKAFVQDDDVRPPRTKAFHAFGTAAKMRFVAEVPILLPGSSPPVALASHERPWRSACRITVRPPPSSS